MTSINPCMSIDIIFFYLPKIYFYEQTYSPTGMSIYSHTPTLIQYLDQKEQDLSDVHAASPQCSAPKLGSSPQFFHPTSNRSLGHPSREG